MTASLRSMRNPLGGRHNPSECRRNGSCSATPPARPMPRKIAIDPAGIAGARQAKLTSRIQPLLATLAEAAPDGGNWLHEVKFDGYRILAFLEGGRVRLVSRNGLDWTSRFREISGDIGKLPATAAIVDGEVVALAENGVSSFGALQQALSTGATGGLVYYGFDLLYVDGYDLRPARLDVRKDALRTLLAGAPSRIQYSDHHAGSGPAFLRHACGMKLEGIVSKLAASTYIAGRSRSWLKVKCVQREEFVVLGYTDPEGSRVGIGSLILGYYDPAGTLRLAGKVGTGFDTATLLQLRQILEALPSTPTVPQ